MKQRLAAPHEAGRPSGPGRVREDAPAVPHPVRRRREGRAGHHRVEPGEPRLPAGKRLRPVGRHPEGVRRQRADPDRAAESSRGSSRRRSKTRRLPGADRQRTPDRPEVRRRRRRPERPVDDAGRISSTGSRRVDVRSLVAYSSATRRKRTLAATRENAKDFFNGKDLTGWDADLKPWGVENGENSVGKTAPASRTRRTSFPQREPMAAADFRLTLKAEADAGRGE